MESCGGLAALVALRETHRYNTIIEFSASRVETPGISKQTQIIGPMLYYRWPIICDTAPAIKHPCWARTCGQVVPDTGHGHVADLDLARINTKTIKYVLVVLHSGACD